jgi:hypothetical protein
MNEQEKQQVKRAISVLIPFTKDDGGGQGLINYYHQLFGLEWPFEAPLTVPSEQDKARKLHLIENAMQYKLYTESTKPYKMVDRRVFWKNRKGGKA